jgi:hypothetical protein
MVPSVRSLEPMEFQRRVYFNKSFQTDCPLFSTAPAVAYAGISAVLSLAIVKSRGPLTVGGTECSTLRSTIGRNGASFWAKHD